MSPNNATQSDQGTALLRRWAWGWLQALERHLEMIPNEGFTQKVNREIKQIKNINKTIWVTDVCIKWLHEPIFFFFSGDDKHLISW